MSLRLKTISATCVLGWLVAVPLLGTALLGPIVGFGAWPDGLLPGGDDTVRLADAPQRPDAVAAAPRSRDARLSPGAAGPTAPALAPTAAADSGERGRAARADA